MFDVSLQLLCTSKSGTLSRVIREIILLGLQYKHHQTVTCSEFHGFSFRFEQGGLIVSIKPWQQAGVYLVNSDLHGYDA